MESPFAALRLRTDAAKRFKKIESATAVIFKLPRSQEVLPRARMIVGFLACRLPSFWLTGFSIALGALAWPYTARRSAGFWSVGFVVSAFTLLGHVPVVSARLGFRISALVVYDQLAPKITQHPTREDIRAWCRHKDLAVEHLDLCTGNSWRADKAHGLEARVPYLDLELVEFCWLFRRR